MCDYSLENLQSRPAAVGDKLITTPFPNTITRGFKALDGDPNVAVCLLPGTELAFDRNIVAHVAHLLFSRNKEFEEKTAVFREVNTGIPYSHHDAIELPSGTVLYVTTLALDQTVTVIQLPVTEKAKAEPVTEEVAEPVT